MKKIDPELHNSFVGSKLLIFKGDLNYRKLVGDVCWPHTEKFSVALRGFGPAPLVTLRTIKADVAVGLQPGQAEKVAENDTDWLLTGKYAVVSCFSWINPLVWSCQRPTKYPLASIPLLIFFSM